MDEDLPSEFDLIVVGTGFTESIVAAAASRVGKTVLHLDALDFYGGYWASFNLDAIQSLTSNDNISTPYEIITNDETIRFKFDENYKSSQLKNVTVQWITSDGTTDDAAGIKAKALQDFRKFNIDITPKLLFSRGDLVELLISSNICRYVEFRAVDRVTTHINDELMAIPCSRSDVFNTKEVTVVEKRILMKLLANCSDESNEAEFKTYESKTFAEYLRDNRLTAKLQHYVLYAIAMGSKEMPFRDGLLATRRFLHSIGRYGSAPFLFPMYGCGEIPQCFCRLCAVFGGVYCLKRPIAEVTMSAAAAPDQHSKFQSIKCGDQIIRSENIIFGSGTINAAPSGANESQPIVGAGAERCGEMARGIFLINRPIGDEKLNSGGGGVIFLKMPGCDGDDAGGAYVMQLSHFSGTCPKDWYLIHVTAKSRNQEPEEALRSYVDILLKDYAWKTPAERTSIDAEVAVETEIERLVVWSMYFTIPACGKCSTANTWPRGLHVACGPMFELDYEHSIKQAKEMFKEMYPNDDFLPRAPDPEEIIIGGEDVDGGNGVEDVTTSTAVAKNVEELP